MRLDKFLSNNTSLTRSQARRVIRRGQVRMAGEICRDASAAVAPEAEVEWKDALVRKRGPRYLMLYKPAGYVSVTEHETHPTVLDLLGDAEPHGLHAAGRLDLSATGLVLLTDDGGWSHRLTSPRRHCPKRYRVGLAEPLAETAIDRLREGLMLKGESTSTLPAEVERLDEHAIRLTVYEGRYHQVKRMLAAVGNKVTTLHREAIGAIELDPALDPGEWRWLTQDEVLAAVGSLAQTDRHR